MTKDVERKHQLVFAGNPGIIRGNIPMRFCFIIAVSLGVLSPVSRADSHETDNAVSSVVRADPRSGRLIRRIVLPPRMVTARVIDSRKPQLNLPTPALGPQAVHDIVEEVSGSYRVDPLMVHAIIHVESSYNRFALSPKGAQGLMQLIPSTARRFGVRNSFDSRQNIEGGVKYLRRLLDRFDDLRLVFAAYNAGEEAVARYRGIPPYAETQDYVYKVGKRLGELRRTQQRLVAQARHPAAPVNSSEYRPLESFIDSEGRLHLKTR